MPRQTTTAPTAGPLTTAEKLKQLDKRVARLEDDNATLRRDLARVRKVVAELADMVEHNGAELLRFSEGMKSGHEAHIGRLGEHEVAITRIDRRLAEIAANPDPRD